MTVESPTAPRIVRAAEEAERIWIAGDTVHVVAGAGDTGGAFTMLTVDVAPGGGPPLHYHEGEDEAFHVLDGAFAFAIDGEPVRAEAGAFLMVPRGTPHAWHNAGDAPARMLIVFTPGGIEGFFREAGRAAVGDGPAPPVDAGEIARTGAAGARYGLNVMAWDR
jgi:quercetin dioxygenase-like cupin family protein